MSNFLKLVYMHVFYNSGPVYLQKKYNASIVSAITKKAHDHTETMQYMTEYWRTDRNVTLGQLHFIGPANSHTHTLSVHCCINGLS